MRIMLSLHSIIKVLHYIMIRLVDDENNLIFDNSRFLLLNSGVGNIERYKHIHPGWVTWLFPTPST
jgi:hypothetical protein